MTIEGNDWWAIAGAAGGGVVIGAVGAKLFKGSDPLFTGIRRWYEVPSTEDVRKRAIATIWQKGDLYWLRIYVLEMPTGSYLRDERYYLGLIADGIPYEVEAGDLESMEEATSRADALARSMEMEPITEWGYASEKLKVRG